MTNEEIIAAKDAEIATLKGCVVKLQDSLCAAKRHMSYATLEQPVAHDFSQVAIGEGAALMSMMRDDVKVADFRAALVSYAAAVQDAQPIAPAAAVSAPSAGVHAKIECFGFSTEDVRLILTGPQDKHDIRMHKTAAKFVVEAIAAANRSADVSAPTDLPPLPSAMHIMESTEEGDDEPIFVNGYTSEEMRAYALAARAAAPVSGPTDGVHWDLFPGYLIDHCERDTITEEGLQFALAKMLKDTDYLRVVAERAAAPSDPMTDKLLTIIAYAYQIAGAHDAPDHILDVLANPDEATDEQIEAMLPYVVAPVSGQGASIGDDPQFHSLITVYMTTLDYWDNDLTNPIVKTAARNLVQFIDSRPRSEDSRAKALGEEQYTEIAEKVMPRFDLGLYLNGEVFPMAPENFRTALDLAHDAASTPPKADNE